METRPYFLIGDLIANAVAGAVTGALMAAISRGMKTQSSI